MIHFGIDSKISGREIADKFLVINIRETKKNTVLTGFTQGSDLRAARGGKHQYIFGGRKEIHGPDKFLVQIHLFQRKFIRSDWNINFIAGYLL